MPASRLADLGTSGKRRDNLVRGRLSLFGKKIC